MIDRNLLKEIGFELGTGFGREVWVYDGMFWVYYCGEFSGLPGQQIDGNSATNRQMFDMLLTAVSDNAVEAATYGRQYEGEDE